MKAFQSRRLRELTATADGRAQLRRFLASRSEADGRLADGRRLVFTLRGDERQGLVPGCANNPAVE